jgi:hypothetical protein
MVSDDLLHLADKIAGFALHDTAPTSAECAAIAAELMKFSGIVASMESLPLSVVMDMVTAVPEWVLAQTGRKP